MMETTRTASVKRNYIYNLAYQLLTMMIPLITAPYVARVLLPEGVGVFSYSRSVAQYFLLFGMQGINNYGSRSIAAIRENESERNRRFSSMYYFQLLSTGSALGLYLIYALAVTRRYPQIAACQIVYVLTGLLDVNWFFFGLEEFRRPVIGKSIIKLGATALIFLTVRTPDHLGRYTLISAAGYMLGQAYMILYLRHAVRLVRVPMREVLRHFRPCLLLFVPVLATSVYRMMDKVMLGLMSSYTQTGYYENSEKLISVCLCVISALGTVMLPRMSNLYAHHRKKDANAYLRKSMHVAMFFACAIAFGIGAVVHEFIPIFYGAGYEPCVGLTRMLVFTVLPISWANVIRTQYLIPCRKEKAYTCSVCAGAAVNLALNALLIGRFGARGAAAGTIAAEWTVCLLQSLLVRRKLKLRVFFTDNLFFVLAGAVMFAVVQLMRGLPLNRPVLLVLEIAAGALCYLSLSVFYWIKTKNPIAAGLWRRICRRGGPA